MAYAPMYESWRIAEEGMEIDVLLDLGHGEDFPLRSHSWFFGVRLPMARTNEDGLPGAEEEHRLNLVENRIREVIRDREGVYVGRRTGGGNRDLVFYMTARARALEDRIRVSVGTEILFISREDKKWAAYRSMLPGAREWRQIEDRKLVDGVLDLGALQEALHAVVHQVGTPIAKGAQALERLFAKLELTEITTTGTGKNLVVHGTQHATMEVEPIHRVSWILENKAPQARGNYMGWTAEPIFHLAEDEDLLGEDVEDEADELLAILESMAASNPE
jgi:hypothetical protein